MEVKRNGSQPSGTAPTTAIIHISVVELLNGKSADWMEHVSDEQYLAGSETE